MDSKDNYVQMQVLRTNTKIEENDRHDNDEDNAINTAHPILEENNQKLLNLEDQNTFQLEVSNNELEGRSEIDGRSKRNNNTFATKRKAAEGMMDIALLTANANQLRFVITYNTNSQTFYLNVILIILSLVLQIAVGIALIFKRQMKNRGYLNKASTTNEFLVVGVFMVTIINVFVAAFTTTDSINNNNR